MLLKSLSLILLISLTDHLVVGDVNNTNSDFIKASGGGIAKKGSNMVISYYPKTKEFGEECDWFFENNICSFKTTKEIVKCKFSDKLKQRVDATNSNTSFCEITIKSFQESDVGIWKARGEYEGNLTPIEVGLAEEIDKNASKIWVDGGNQTKYFKSGQPGNISCELIGGVPAPFIAINMFPEFNLNKTLQTNDSQIKDDKGVYHTKQIMKVNLTSVDHGKSIYCSAIQKDYLNQETIFEFQTNNFTLNVTFSPENFSNKTQKYSISFDIYSNPEPSKAIWVVRDKNRNTLHELTPGKNDNPKYNFPQFENKTNAMYKFEFSLNETALSEIDKSETYMLVVENSMGSTKIDFNLNIDETNPPKPNNTGSNTGKIVGYVFLGLFLTTLVIIGVCLAFKKRESSPTVPLSTLETRN